MAAAAGAVSVVRCTHAILIDAGIHVTALPVDAEEAALCLRILFVAVRITIATRKLLSDIETHTATH